MLTRLLLYAEEVELLPQLAVVAPRRLCLQVAIGGQLLGRLPRSAIDALSGCVCVCGGVCGVVA
jgi:hypothetical protein